jgi:hypothetical protein
MVYWQNEEQEGAMKRKTRRGKKMFCTECGSALDNFCFAPADYVDILKNHFECQRTGNFRGAVCSKLFIADASISALKAHKSKLSAKKLASLKSSILQKIATEEVQKK